VGPQVTTVTLFPLNSKASILTDCYNLGAVLCQMSALALDGKHSKAASDKDSCCCNFLDVAVAGGSPKDRVLRLYPLLGGTYIRMDQLSVFLSQVSLPH
jgi:hypothetical protein